MCRTWVHVRRHEVACCVFFQAEDVIRDLVRSRGLGYVYKRQAVAMSGDLHHYAHYAPEDPADPHRITAGGGGGNPGFFLQLALPARGLMESSGGGALFEKKKQNISKQTRRHSTRQPSSHQERSNHRI